MHHPPSAPAGGPACAHVHADAFASDATFLRFLRARAPRAAASAALRDRLRRLLDRAAAPDPSAGGSTSGRGG
jgi:hypothetical protein